MRFRRFRSLPILATLLLGAAGPTLGEESQDVRTSYAFLRTLDGSAAIAAAGAGMGDEAEVNQPLLSGDALRVSRGSRAELLLPDRNRLLVEGGSVLVLDRLAFSGDREERVTVLRLDDGEILLEVGEDALGDELPRIDTPHASLYIHEPGLYRVAVDDASWTEVTTRRGFAELVTERGSTIVRADETALAEGGRWGRVELSAAGSLDRLERWNRELAERATRASRSGRYVEPYLAYASAPLDEYGSWIIIDSVGYWQPHVNNVWRPYWDGRWAWTPSGYTWVSYEPWGWVPYHYGTWSIVAGHGWLWRPGPRYSPAWVYWNWNDGWAGWCPIGYYSSHYDPWYRSGFRLGFYGWSGGGWGIYADWNFAPTHCFRDRRFRGFVRTGHDWQREHRTPAPPRGLITTDTRGFRPDHLGKPDDMLRRLRMQKLTPNEGGVLDVTDFVARKRELPNDVVHAIAPAPGKGGRIGDAPVVQVEPGWRARQESPRKQSPAGAVTQGRRPGADSPSLSTAPRQVEPKPETSSRTRSGETGEVRRVTEPRVSNPSADGGWRSESSGKGERAPVASDDRQGWKRSAPETGSGRGYVKPDESSGAKQAPVERVVGGVRRSAPKTEAPTQAEPSRRPYVENDKGSTGGSPRSIGGTRERAPGGSNGSASETPKSAPVYRDRSSGSAPDSGKSAPTYRERSSAPKVSDNPPPSGSSRQPSVRSTPPPSRDSGSVKPSGGGSANRSSGTSRNSGGSSKNSGGSSKSSGSSKDGGSGSGKSSSSGSSKHGVG